MSNASSLSLSELLAEVGKRRNSDRPAALTRLSEIDTELKKLVAEIVDLCESYQLEFTFSNDDGIVDINIDRQPGWNSSSYRC